MPGGSSMSAPDKIEVYWWLPLLWVVSMMLCGLAGFAIGISMRG